MFLCIIMAARHFHHKIVPNLHGGYSTTTKMSRKVLLNVQQQPPSLLFSSVQRTIRSFTSSSTSQVDSGTGAGIEGSNTNTNNIRNNINDRQQWLNRKEERPRRCLFSVPGCVPKMLNKAKILNADAVVLDLEDGVPIREKENARQLVQEVLSSPHIQFGRSEVCVRINSLSCSSTEEMAITDLRTILSCPQLQAIILPKVESAAEIHYVNQLIAEARTGRRSDLDSTTDNNCSGNCGNSCKNNTTTTNLLNPDVRILAAIESAWGLQNIQEIARTAGTTQLDGLIFASEDYCTDIGATRTSSPSLIAPELLYARSKLVTTAKAYNVQAIDMVHIHFRDIEMLKLECQNGKEFGFTGKQAIHPNQILPIHEAFSPSLSDILFAEKIVQQFHGEPIEINGVVVDTPIYKWAVKLMRRAKAADITLIMNFIDQTVP